MYYLYQLTFSNGKVYIGQTVRTMNVRMAQHRTSAKRGSNLPVHNAWRKYGEPSVSILLECDCAEELHQAEIDMIQKCGSLAPNGYNLSPGGDTAPSKSPEVAAKIATKARGRKIADTTAVSDAIRRNWQNDEYRQKVSDGLKASWNDERRKAVSERFKSMWAKRKQDGWMVSDDTKCKLTKRTFSEATRAKIAAATKKAWQDQEITDRRISAIKEAKAKKE